MLLRSSSPPTTLILLPIHLSSFSSCSPDASGESKILAAGVWPKVFFPRLFLLSTTFPPPLLLPKMLSGREGKKKDTRSRFLLKGILFFSLTFHHSLPSPLLLFASQKCSPDAREKKRILTSTAGLTAAARLRRWCFFLRLSC